MLAMLLLVLQDIPGPPADDAVVARTPLTGKRCGRGADEIVVCGAAQSPRLTPLPEPGTRQLVGPATVALSPNKRAGVRVENNANPTVSAPRLMLDFIVDF